MMRMTTRRLDVDDVDCFFLSSRSFHSGKNKRKNVFLALHWANEQRDWRVSQSERMCIRGLICTREYVYRIVTCAYVCVCVCVCVCVRHGVCARVCACV